MLSQYPVLLSVILGIAVLVGAFYIYRKERHLEIISRSEPTAEKTESTRPWSRQFLINENDLESGPQVEDEDDRESFHYQPPMIAGDSSLSIVLPLAFDDMRLVPRSKDPLAVSPPQSSPVDLPSQPSAVFLPNSHARRGSDTVALTRATPGVHGVAYLRDPDGVETARSSLASISSTFPPSYHSDYPDPVNLQRGQAPELHLQPASSASSREDEGVTESGAGRRRRSFDGGVRLAGGRPGEGDNEAFGAEEVSGMPPTYHDL